MKFKKLVIYVLSTFCLICPTGLLAGLASANYNYINDLVGDRAMGLGGAYGAISDDPSGSFYNPAGLAFAFDNQISLSVNTFKMKNIVYEGAVFSDNNYNQNISSFYPSFFGVVQTFGEVKVAIVFMNLNNEILDQDDYYNNIRIPEASATTNYVTANTHINYNNTDNSFVFGLSTGFFLSDKLTLGFSVFPFNRNREQIFNQMNEVVDPHGATGINAGDIYTTNVYRTDKFWGISGKAGLQWMPLNELALGLTVGGGAILSHSSDAQTLQGGVISRSSSNVETSAIPVDLRVGVAFFPSNKFLLSADFIGHFGTTNFETEVQSTYNGAIGAEYYITDMIPVRLGIFTNFAATPPMDANVYRQDMNVNLYGASASISLESRNSSITLSGFYQYGEGQSEIGTDITATERTVIHMFQVALTGTAKY